MRSHAYRRMELEEWKRTREIAWSALIGSHMNPKRLPKSKERFMALSAGITKKKRQEMNEAILQAQKIYAEEMEAAKKVAKQE